MEKVIIYHTDVDPQSASTDDLDVFDQARFVSGVLSSLGYESIALPFRIGFESPESYDSSQVREELAHVRPKVVFNLVESVGGSDTYAYIAPRVFEDCGVPFTGCPSSAHLKSASKTHAKRIMDAAGISTPYYISLENISQRDLSGKKFLVKSDREHASKGLEERLYGEREELEDALRSKGAAFFAEEYIDGREFNISCMGKAREGVVLPVAEMRFVNWQEGKPKLVGYSAKWEEGSYEWTHMERVFDFGEGDRALVAELERMTRACWEAFDLRGYARVDFRVSNEGKPYVLEINTNPCIAPDAGFIAAAERAGLTHEEVIGKIVDASLGPRG